MHQLLVDHIDAKIQHAGRFVLDYMPLDISIDTAYEAMIACNSNHTPAMIAAFQSAVKYLPPVANYKKFNFLAADGRSALLQVRFMPTAKWPAFLIPDGPLTIDPEGYFSAMLDAPIRVATEWATLDYLWQILRSPTLELSPYVLAYLLPWIRECLADFDSTNIEAISNQERRNIEKELSMIMNDWKVTHFPRMSKLLTNIARSGRHLFAQYQMIDAAYTRENLIQSPITVLHTPTLVESRVRQQISEMWDDWVIDEAERRKRQIAEAVEKAVRRRAARRANPQGE